MEALYGWLRNITCYLLFLAVINNLLPGKKYGKYIKLFAGMILILLVLQPFTGSARLDNRIARYYESFVFRYQADDLKKEILGTEEKRLADMIRQYEEAVARDVTQMAADAEMEAAGCQVRIEPDEESEKFGTVTEIRLQVWAEGAPPGQTGADPPDDTAGSGAGETVPPVQPVEPVEIGDRGQAAGEGGDAADPDGGASAGAAGDTDLAGAAGDTDPADPAGREQRAAARTAAESLRKKIASYYNLEEDYVEVQVVEGQG